MGEELEDATIQGIPVYDVDANTFFVLQRVAPMSPAKVSRIKDAWEASVGADGPKLVLLEPGLSLKGVYREVKQGGWAPSWDSHVDT